MRSRVFLFFVFITTALTGISQPAIQWQKCFGGSKNDYAYSIKQTIDGGFIIAGYSTSNDGDVSGNHVSLGTHSDYWIVKLDTGGVIQWQKCLGGTKDDYAYQILQTPDKGYLLLGDTYSKDGDVVGNHDTLTSNSDVWIVKTDSLGTIQWQKSMGGSREDYGGSILPTLDGGYIMAGTTQSHNGDVSGNHDTTGSYYDLWVVKMSGTGSIQWQKCYGGPGNDGAYLIAHAIGGGYIIAGYADINGGDISGNHGNIDDWIIRIDTAGNLKWQKCYGGSKDDYAYSILQTNDSNYVIAGRSASNSGDVSGNHDTTGFEDDFWIFKIDTSGSIIWQKCYGGSKQDYVVDLEKTLGGGYIVAGETYSNDGDVSGNHDTHGIYSDYWLIKLDEVGNIRWQKCLGGTNNDYVSSVQQTSSGAYIIAGIAYSNNGDVTGNHDTSQTYADYWIVKLAPDTVISVQEINGPNSNLLLYPNPARVQITASLTGSSFKTVNVAIINYLGQQVFFSKIKSEGEKVITINIESFSPGIYKLILFDLENILSTSFVKE